MIILNVLFSSALPASTAGTLAIVGLLLLEVIARAVPTIRPYAPVSVLTTGCLTALTFIHHAIAWLDGYLSQMIDTHIEPTLANAFAPGQAGRASKILGSLAALLKLSVTTLRALGALLSAVLTTLDAISRLADAVLGLDRRGDGADHSAMRDVIAADCASGYIAQRAVAAGRRQALRGSAAAREGASTQRQTAGQAKKKKNRKSGQQRSL